MYPDIPHEAPQEFLTYQKVGVYPAAKTPWSMEVPQREKIPLL
jgi:hypothetical protein